MRCCSVNRKDFINYCCFFFSTPTFQRLLSFIFHFSHFQIYQTQNFTCWFSFDIFTFKIFIYVFTKLSHNTHFIEYFTPTFTKARHKELPTQSFIIQKTKLASTTRSKFTSTDMIHPVKKSSSRRKTETQYKEDGLRVYLPMDETNEQTTTGKSCVRKLHGIETSAKQKLYTKKLLKEETHTVS